MGLVRDNVELSEDDPGLSLASDTPAGSDQVDIIEPGITTLDAPPAEEMELPPAFEFDISTFSEAEATPSDPVVPTLDAGTSTAEETPHEGLLTSSDMFTLENLGDSLPLEHLTLELEPPVLPADLASSRLKDAPPTPPPPDIPEPPTSAGTEPDLPLAEAVSFEDLDDIALPGHLTLELDTSELASEISSISLDNLQPENPPGDIQAKMPSHDDQADDEEELFLDLENLELDDSDESQGKA
jgi:hypothetical protein